VNRGSITLGACDHDAGIPGVSGGRHRTAWVILMIAVLVMGGALATACGQSLQPTTSVSEAAPTTSTVTEAALTTTTLASAITAWTDLAPAAPMPDPRSGTAMVYDSATDDMILFGGWDVDTDFGDTWGYDPDANTWTDLKPTGDLPPARALHQLVYDPAGGKAILFGGTSDAGRYNDTWAYDSAANTWTDLSGSTAPSARSVHSMAYDSGSGKIVLFGGYDGTSEVGDTWSYDPAANTWTDLKPDGSVPSARKAAAMAYDPVSGRVILFGGYDGSSVLDDTWAYDPAANTWTEVDPAGAIPIPRANHRMVYDEATGQVILFGGYDGQNDLYDTWAYDPATITWTDLDPLGPPPPAREEHAMVYDSAGNRVIVFGGLDYAADRDLSDTWALGEWTD
jgi:N-acetylneuraminic acid mutarotase